MPEQSTVHGPYDTGAEARADARAVYSALDEENRPGTMSQASEGILLAALAAAGVQLGDYDRLIAGWLAGWEPETVQVVIGWIERAHRSGASIEQDQAHEPALGFIHRYAGLGSVHCGAQDGTASMIWADVTCPACHAQIAQRRGDE